MPGLGSETASTASKSSKQRGSMRYGQRTCKHHKQHFASGRAPTSSAAAMRSWRVCLGLLVTLPTCLFCSTFRIDLNSREMLLLSLVVVLTLVDKSCGEQVRYRRSGLPPSSLARFISSHDGPSERPTVAGDHIFHSTTLEKKVVTTPTDKKLAQSSSHALGKGLQQRRPWPQRTGTPWKCLV
jgi:hypothetical protein